MIIGPNKTFEEPTAEESRPASQEDPLTANVVPQIASLLEDVIEVLRQDIRAGGVHHQAFQGTVVEEQGIG